MAQGFVRILNLNESNSPSNDRNAINNLGGTGISNDLTLFSNNILNKTVIEAGTYVSDNDYVILDSNTYQVSLSNRTKVKQGDQEYTVINSNGIDRFQLVDDTDTIVSANSQLDIVRSDVVTLDNIRRIVSTSIPTDQTAAQTDQGGGISVSESGALVGSNLGNTTRVTLEEIYNNIENLIDKYRYDRTFSIVTDLLQTFDRRINYESVVTVTNDTVPPISLPTGAGQTDNAPGIFIASGVNAQRAFSNNNNPWSNTETGSNYMLTLSSQATISTLVVTDPDFEYLSTSSVSPSPADVLNVYTHKIETSINGETYYILCSSN